MLNDCYHALEVAQYGRNSLAESCAKNVQFSSKKLTNNFSGTFVVKSGFATMVRGGLIMDVVNAEQAKIAQAAGVSILH